ncbi:DEAD/DEAH box helicase [Corynebacterium zhongnanshanii]|uniref:DEAD/DEAH box helicase n=1 Tax=Corynebacterium zhongnanshanii TaxID=2768834 RepID=A0ABQ6VH89_9CORY|nr:DEAD/DEAH box helicase [Corynebacterium zhongnanshanii]KAB3523693.1 DEAD/DEAH box helicase [Corynebacterium zhongnanshanii]
MADPSVTFVDLGVPHELAKALASEGARHPFPIQKAAIPQALEGRDILGRGPTGSGKTFTFGVPMVARLQGGASAPRAPRALMLAPTRELATQIRQRLEPIAHAAGQRVLDVVGGVKISRNITALARPVDILVATPGRAQDLIDQKILSFDAVSVVAVDEADQMADMGFLPQVTRLMDLIDPEAQHLLFSATLDGDVQVLVNKYMKDPVTHSTGDATATVDRMDHVLGVMADREERNDAVIELGALGVKTVMFMRTKHATDRQAKKLNRRGVHAVALHGDKGQSTREKTLAAFASGEAQVLVATDIAARGIDVKGVDLVVHIDPPAEHKAYVHRAGRTARAGSEGTVVTLTFKDVQQDTVKMMTKAGVSPNIVTRSELVTTVRSLVDKGR